MTPPDREHPALPHPAAPRSLSDEDRMDAEAVEASIDDDAEVADPAEKGWSRDDIEQAYRQALDAMNAIEQEVGSESDGEMGGGPADGREAAETSIEQDLDVRPGLRTSSSSPGHPGESSRLGHPEEGSESRRGGALTPVQILEAVLFVGGRPLTAQKLAAVLRGDFDAEFVAREIDGLNTRYAEESRPYEIRLGEGGYRMALREEFERVRHRVFGMGPKEVRLSQEALEVLALVAYRQPIAKKEIEEAGREGAGGILRQLLRRELIAIERGAKGRDDVRYRTTPRFLQLFGIGGLDELPRADELSFK